MLIHEIGEQLRQDNKGIKKKRGDFFLFYISSFLFIIDLRFRKGTAFYCPESLSQCNG